MSFVIIALLPILLFGIYNTGYYSNLASGQSTSFFYVILKGLKIVMPLVLVSYGVGFFWEFLFAIKRKHPVSEGLLVSGMLFPLILPPTIPLWQAAIGISFGIVVGKEIFGGTGRNFLNPALTARAFLFFAYPVKMSGDAVWIVVDGVKKSTVDIVSGATPLAISAIAEYPEKVETMLNNSGFTLETLFLGLYPGSIGETSTLLCIIGALFIVLTGIANYRIIIGGIVGVLITALVLKLLNGSSNPYFDLNPLYHLVTGGFAFGIAFMATDPVSAPGLNISRWIYGFLIGFFTVIIRVINPAFADGTMLSILFMNVFAHLLDHFELKYRNKKRIPNG